MLKNRAPNAPADHGCTPDASACETASVAGRCPRPPFLRARWAARGWPGCCTSPCCRPGSAGRRLGLHVHEMSEVRYAIYSLSFSQKASQLQGMKPTHFVIDQEITVAK